MGGPAAALPPLGNEQGGAGLADRRGIEREVRGIATPTQVIVGADDRATPPPKSQRIAELIGGARLVQIPGCGHSSAVEQPDAVSALLTEFLDR